MLKPTTPMQQRSPSPRSGIWTSEEHKLYLKSLRLLRGSTWRERARLIGTRTERQVISHHQKYVRRLKRLRQNPHHKVQAREEHFVDPEILDIVACNDRRSQVKPIQVISMSDRADAKSESEIDDKNETGNMGSLDEHAIDLKALLMTFDSASGGGIQEFSDQLEIQNPHMQIEYDEFVDSYLPLLDDTAFEKLLVGLEPSLVVDDSMV